MGNANARIVSSYEFLVSCVKLLLSLSRSRWFQFVPGISSLFQLVPGSSNSFQLVHHFSTYATRHVRRLSPIFVGWNQAITGLSFLTCIYELKSFWRKISFWMNMLFLNQTKNSEWTWTFWMKLLKLNYWIENILLNKYIIIA